MDAITDDVNELKDLVKHYKFASESFEKRVLDLQQELAKKDEEIKMWKEKYESSLAVSKDTSLHNVEEGKDYPHSLSMRKLFIGGLPQEVTDEMLSSYFSAYGTVQDATVVKDNATQKSRGFGFVVFTQPYMTDIAQNARPHKLCNKEVDTKRAIPKSTIDASMSNPHIQSKRVFIGGLRQSTTSDVIRDYFRNFGEVLTVDLIEDLSNGKSRGFAYVTFSDSDSTDKVIVQKYHMIDHRKCEAKPAFHKVPKNQYQEPPMFNNQFNDFQALFGAFQQQQQQYYNHQYKGTDDKNKCHNCDSGVAGTESTTDSSNPFNHSFYPQFNDMADGMYNQQSYNNYFRNYKNKPLHKSKPY